MLIASKLPGETGNSFASSLCCIFVNFANLITGIPKADVGIAVFTCRLGRNGSIKAKAIYIGIINAGGAIILKKVQIVFQGPTCKKKGCFNFC